MRKKTGAFILALILCFTMLAASGCLIDLDELNGENESPPVTEEETENEEEIAGDEGWQVPEVEDECPALPCIADVVAEVKPAVVSINTEMVTRDIFNREYTSEGAGSGWIIDETGYIVTNNHVVEGAQAITIILDDGRSFEAELIGRDPLTDLAVVKISAEDSLPVAKIGDSKELRIGDWVVAIGNSLGQGIRATTGIVSRQGASLPEEDLYGLIETDAAINPGNSGGPLVNLSGEVIGITNAKLVSTEIESVGYAISLETAESVIEQLINTGKAIHPWVGVSIYPYEINESIVQQLSLKQAVGALLVEVIADSPAGKAGLQAYDVIVSFAGRKVDNSEDLVEAIRFSKVGQEVEITYWRGEDKTTTSATLVERPDNP